MDCAKQESPVKVKSRGSDRLAVKKEANDLDDVADIDCSKRDSVDEAIDEEEKKVLEKDKADIEESKKEPTDLVRD